MLLDVIDGTSFKSNFDDIVPLYPTSILSFISSDDVVFSLFVFCAVSVSFTVFSAVVSFLLSATLFSVVVFSVLVLFVVLLCEVVSIFPSTSNISFLTYPVYVLYFILYHSPSSDKTSTSSSNDINVTTLDSVDASFLILTVS